MNILFVADNYLPQTNGIVSQILVIRKELERRGHTVFIVAPTFGKKLSYKGEQRVYRVPSIPLPIRPTDRLVYPFHGRTLKALKNIDIDIIHCHQGLLSEMGHHLKRKKGVPHIVTAHTSFHEFFRWISPGLARKLWKLIDSSMKIYFDKFDMVLAPSGKAFEFLAACGTEVPVHMLYNGVDQRGFSDISPDLFRKKFKINAADPLLVLVGRIEVGKNVDLAVRSMHHVLKKFPATKLAIVGDGPKRNEIERLISTEGLGRNIILTGFLQSELVISANKAATVVLMASDTDTLPTVLIEAISCGKAVAAVDDPAVLPVVKDGINGILAEKNVESFSDAIIRLLSDLELLEKFEANSVKIAENFSIGKYCDALEKIYLELIEMKK